MSFLAKGNRTLDKIMEIDAGKEQGLIAALPAALKQALHIPFRHLWKFGRIMAPVNHSSTPFCNAMLLLPIERGCLFCHLESAPAS